MHFDKSNNTFPRINCDRNRLFNSKLNFLKRTSKQVSNLRYISQDVMRIIKIIIF